MPEGFATIATFKRKNVPRRTRLLLSAAFVIPIFLGATLGFWFVRGRAEIVKQVLLAFTAGILITLVIEEIIPEAHEDGEARVAALVFVGALLSLRSCLSIWTKGTLGSPCSKQQELIVAV